MVYYLRYYFSQQHTLNHFPETRVYPAGVGRGFHRPDLLLHTSVQEMIVSSPQLTDEDVLWLRSNETMPRFRSCWSCCQGQLIAPSGYIQSG